MTFFLGIVFSSFYTLLRSPTTLDSFASRPLRLLLRPTHPSKPTPPDVLIGSYILPASPSSVASSSDSGHLSVNPGEVAVNRAESSLEQSDRHPKHPAHPSVSPPTPSRRAHDQLGHRNNLPSQGPANDRRFTQNGSRPQAAMHVQRMQGTRATNRRRLQFLQWAFLLETSDARGALLYRFGGLQEGVSCEECG